MLFLASVPFDQYQRYGVAARAIEAVRQNGAPLKILEVGSNTHQLLGRLLPNDSIDYLDLEIPEEMRGQINIIVGDATALTLPDKSYDVVVSLDVYEHIPQELREAFLMHTNRVASLLTIVGAPFDSPHTVSAELNALDFWRKIFNTPYRWLVEHAENGLPNLEATEQKVTELGYYTYAMEHGDIDLWTAFIKAHFAEVCVGSLQPVLSTLYDYYQSHIFEKDFSPVQSYRKFIFSSLNGASLQKIKNNFETLATTDNGEDGRALTMALLKLLPSVALEKADDRKTIGERDDQIVTLNHCVADGEARIASINNEMIARIASINNDMVALKALDGQHEGVIADLKQTINTRDRQIFDLYNSNSWRVTSPLRFAFRQIKRVPRAIQLALPAIKLSGGLGHTIKKAVKLFLREGIPGIKRGFRLAAMSTSVAPSANGPEANPSAGCNDYQEWIRLYDTLTDSGRANMRAHQADFARQPLISVLMPTYNPKPEWLIEAIESVRSQIYPHWELCIADDASPDPAVRPILERYAREDSRIKVVFRPQNGHISAASNSALELVTGEWVALLDHDDQLTEHALFWVAHSINSNSDIQLIYSDEDKLNEVGVRSEPYFKCDWNKDLFYSHNLITHLGAYRTDLVQALNGFRVGFEGAQDYDLALRYIEEINENQIYHIPHVLYHWRMHEQSTAQSADAKPYARLAGKNALNQHLQRSGVDATTSLTEYGYRVRYSLPAVPPLVSLIIPTRNGLALVRQCVQSILEYTEYTNYEIIIVDNGSDDPKALQYFKYLSTNPRIRILRNDGPFNYSELNNTAVKQAKGELIGLINNDIEVISPDWLSEMVSQALRPGIGAVGAKLWYPDDTLQHGGVVLGIGGVAAHVFKRIPKNSASYFSRSEIIQSYSAVTAACLVVQKNVYEKVGGLNEVDLKIAFNDVDFCLRITEAGYRNVWTPFAELYHHESASRGLENTPEKQTRFEQEVVYMKERWNNALLNDPAYSQNLTLEHEDFSLAWPPRTKALPLHPSLVACMLPLSPNSHVG